MLNENFVMYIKAKLAFPPKKKPTTKYLTALNNWHLPFVYIYVWLTHALKIVVTETYHKPNIHSFVYAAEL